MARIFIDAETLLKLEIPTDDGTKTWGTLFHDLGFSTIQYHPEAHNWDGMWSLEEHEYIMLVLKYG